MRSAKITRLPPWLTLAFTLPHTLAFAQGTLTNGANHSGAIALAREVDLWTFSASVNDNISVSIGEVLVGAVDPHFNPWIVLKGPMGSRWPIERHLHRRCREFHSAKRYWRVSTHAGPDTRLVHRARSG
jgi:hypothetical protein